jgi:hypothetical protein
MRLYAKRFVKVMPDFCYWVFVNEEDRLDYIFDICEEPDMDGIPPLDTPYQANYNSDHVTGRPQNGIVRTALKIKTAPRRDDMNNLIIPINPLAKACRITYPSGVVVTTYVTLEDVQRLMTTGRPGIQVEVGVDFDE